MSISIRYMLAIFLKFFFCACIVNIGKSNKEEAYSKSSRTFKMCVGHFLVWGCFYPTQAFASSTFPLWRAHKGRKYVPLRKQNFAGLVWTNILTDLQSESRPTNVGRNLFKFLSYSIFGQSWEHGTHTQKNVSDSISPPCLSPCGILKSNVSQPGDGNPIIKWSFHRGSLHHLHYDSEQRQNYSYIK